MTPSDGLGLGVALAVLVTCGAVLVGSLQGWRLARTTSDFYVAGREVSPWRNASAIAAEYLSAASFLGVAGLVAAGGASMLWFPVGHTLGYVVVAALVAAPLRRSGAFTLPDFAHIRLDSPHLRTFTSALVVGLGWLYLLPQLHGADVVLSTLTRLPPHTGSSLVVAVVTVSVMAGGMRSVTDVQAVQYWVKLVAIAVPAFVLVGAHLLPSSHVPEAAPVVPGGVEPLGLYGSVSLLVALCLGTMGLPHIAVRFYTNRDGVAARRTALPLITLLASFYLFPPVYAALARAHTGDLPAGLRPDQLILVLPQALMPGPIASALTVVLAAGAFIAFLSTAAGLAVAVTCVLDQDVVRPLSRRVTGRDLDGATTFRAAALVALVVPLVADPAVTYPPLAVTVALVFAVSASTLCPLLALGIWWRGLTARGAALGMGVGAATSLGCLALVLSGAPLPEAWADLITLPAAWTVPLAFAVTVIASLATDSRIPRTALRTMTRLHMPEHVAERQQRTARRS